GRGPPPYPRPSQRPLLIRQILASLVVLAGAALAWVFFAPGSTETLARVGISLPFGPEAPAQPGRPGGGGGAGMPGMGSGGGRPGGFGGRTTNVVTTAATLATINDRLTAIGEGSAVRSVTVTAPAGGELAEVLVRPGQVVTAG